MNTQILGELFSNKTSREMIKILSENEMYAYQIAKKLNIRISLVIYLLNKLKTLELLEISQKTIVKNGNEHSYYKMKTTKIGVIISNLCTPSLDPEILIPNKNNFWDHDKIIKEYLPYWKMLKDFIDNEAKNTSRK